MLISMVGAGFVVGECSLLFGIGYDSYPNGFDCGTPDVWLADAVPEYFWGAHLEYSPQAPNAVFEFQGGAFDPWGGVGYEDCAAFLGPEFERGQLLSRQSLLMRR